MEYKTVSPEPSSLIQSNRSMGYDFKAAVADIIDNSISANARYVNLYSEYDCAEPFVAIMDNGNGMNAIELENAMRYGSSNPLQSRKKNDLGRFGLGMKVASLSQCSKMTVISKKDGAINGCQWDISVVEKTNEWTIVVLNGDECSTYPLFEKLNKWKHGTVVIWQNLDRIKKSTESLAETISNNLDIARKHIGLTYHRFITGEDGIKKVKICINYKPVSAIDPFLTDNTHTRPLRKERTIPYKKSEITVQAFILPHYDKLTPEERQQFTRSNAYEKQGFYVYRGKRLIIPGGTWFGLERRKDFYDLARVKVDLENDLDDEWNIDIKKSHANLPPDLKDELRRNILELWSDAKIVHKARGRVTKRSDGFVWNQVDLGDHFRYQINEEHPIVSTILSSFSGEQRSKIIKLLRLIEDTVPYTSFYSDHTEKEIRGDVEMNEREDQLKTIAKLMLSAGKTIEELKIMEPFTLYPNFIEMLEKDGHE